jgi:hypothetical protein
VQPQGDSQTSQQARQASRYPGAATKGGPEFSAGTTSLKDYCISWVQIQGEYQTSQLARQASRITAYLGTATRGFPDFTAGTTRFEVCNISWCSHKGSNRIHSRHDKLRGMLHILVQPQGDSQTSQQARQASRYVTYPAAATRGVPEFTAGTTSFEDSCIS